VGLAPGSKAGRTSSITVVNHRPMFVPAIARLEAWTAGNILRIAASEIHDIVGFPRHRRICRKLNSAINKVFDLADELKALAQPR